MTIQELLNIGYKKLKDNKKDDAKFIVKSLLASFLKKDFTYLVVYSNEDMPKDIESKFMNAIQKIINGYPLQYITNKQNFMGIEFFVDENVLIPRADTEILVQEVIDIAKCNAMNRILDMCTGSGAIAVSIAKYIPDCNVMAADISNKALNIAKKNAKNEKVNIRFVESDLFNNINETFDIIVSNPPYIKTDIISKLDIEVQKEPIIALDGGKTGLDFYKKIIVEAKKYLNRNGYLAVEIGYDQKEEVYNLFNENNYQNIRVLKDYGQNYRVVIGRNEG